MERVTYQHSPWDKATVQENDTPFHVGDRVTLDFINRHTENPEPFGGEPDKVYTISADEKGNLGIAGFGDSEAWFYKPFHPLSGFAHDVRFTLVERVEGVAQDGI